MHAYQISEIEDRFIAMLDRRIPLDRREVEMEQIRVQMRWRQRCQLAGFKRLSVSKLEIGR